MYLQDSVEVREGSLAACIIKDIHGLFTWA
jgi:hypothetical protein